jgi:hypothetical protein
MIWCLTLSTNIRHTPGLSNYYKQCVGVPNHPRGHQSTPDGACLAPNCFLTAYLWLCIQSIVKSKLGSPHALCSIISTFRGLQSPAEVRISWKARTLILVLRPFWQRRIHMSLSESNYVIQWSINVPCVIKMWSLSHGWYFLATVMAK